MRIKTSKAVRQLCDEARERGWEASITRGGHVRLTLGPGRTVFMSATPSDWRALHKAAADLRRVERGMMNTCS